MARKLIEISFDAMVYKGVVIETGNILNEAATMARMLGLEFRGTEGKPFEELLESSPSCF